MKARQAAEVLGGRLAGDPEARFSGVSVDTRDLKPGQAFVALKGERTDGHLHLEAAFRAGGTVVVVSREPSVMPERRAAIVVPDTLLGLGKLAKWHRMQFSPRVVGITGSVGKTTTKEILLACLEGSYRTLVSPGNYNTEIGVPLSLFELDSSIEVTVLEMAMRGLGQISYLGDMALQDVAMITNIGPSHMELLGSIGRIAQAKAEILEGASVAVLNRDDQWIGRIARGFGGQIVWYGTSPKSDFMAKDIRSQDEETTFLLVTSHESVRVRLGMPGRHHVENALAAIGAAVTLGVPMAHAVGRLEDFKPPRMRLEIQESGGVRVINDAYNSSPASAVAALETLSSMSGRRVAVLGDMLELGHYTKRGHRRVGKKAAESRLALLVVVGDLGRLIGEAAREAGMPEAEVAFCESNEEALEVLKGYLVPGDIVLVKASRRMRMEGIARRLIGGISQ